MRQKGQKITFENNSVANSPVMNERQAERPRHRSNTGCAGDRVRAVESFGEVWPWHFIHLFYLFSLAGSKPMKRHKEKKYKKNKKTE